MNKTLADILRSYIPDGDGYNSEYAHNLNAAADALESQQSAPTGHDYKRKFECLVDHCKRQDKEIADLRYDQNIRRFYDDGAVWFWAGDETDNLETLACPVVINSGDLRALLAAAPKAGQDHEGPDYEDGPECKGWDERYQCSRGRGEKEVMEEYIEVKRELVEYAMALLEQNCKGSVSNELRALLAAAPKADVQEPVGYGKPDAFIWKDFTTGKQVVSIDRAPHGSRPLYAAPQPVSDGEITKLLSCVRYLTGIAERGMKRSIREDESVESFVLKYVQSLETQPSDDVAEDAARYQWLVKHSTYGIDYRQRPELTLSIYAPDHRDGLSAAIDAAMGQGGSDE